MNSESNIPLRKLAKQILQHHGLSPKKYLSQNFLVDRNIYKKIIAAAELTKSDQVIEIGPGLGFLTTALLDAAGLVTAVEIDKHLAEIVKSLQPVSPGLTVVEQDILSAAIDTLPGIDIQKPYKVVANIPYHITAKIIKKFLTATQKPTHLIVLVQQEVAERICKNAGEHTLLSLSVQYYGQPKIVASVSRKAFYPEPEVASAILKITTSKNTIGNEELFWRLAHMGFASKRKKLVNNIAHGLAVDKADIVGVFAEIGISTDVRAQHLSISDWQSLVEAIAAKNYAQK